jgi:HPt (histidine-containing phosphotransfer) domain-containing protein
VHHCLAIVCGQRVNFAQLDNVSGGDVSVEKEIFGAYLSSWDQTMASLEKALKEKNPQDSKLYAHSMKGACLSIGFTRLSEIFKEMERLSLDARFGEIERMLPVAYSEHAVIKDAMKDYFTARTTTTTNNASA